MHERRHSPRYPIEGSVRVRASDSPWCDGQVADISALGVGLLVSRATASSLAQVGSALMQGDRIEIEWASDEQATEMGVLRIVCRVRHARRLSVDAYHVGALFQEPDVARQAQIAALVGWARKLAGC